MSREDEIQFNTLSSKMTRRRITRIVLYSLLFLGGISSIAFPSQILLDETDSFFGLLWAGFFASSSLLALVGASFERWDWEMGALPALFCTFTVFALVLVSNGLILGNHVVFSYAFLYGAFASSLLTRWIDLQSLKRASKILSTGV